jgi:Putative peptidoglycan binding domain
MLGLAIWVIGRIPVRGDNVLGDEGGVMEPTAEVIVAVQALASSDAVKAGVEAVVKDSYDGLKAVIRCKSPTGRAGEDARRRRRGGGQDSIQHERRYVQSRKRADRLDDFRCPAEDLAEEGSIMSNTMRRNVLACLTITVGLGLSQAAQAAAYNPVTQQAQSKLASLGINPGPLDGVAGGATSTAVQTFQKQSGLPGTGILDAATLEKLGIGTSDKSNAVADWAPPPTQDDLDKLTAQAANDPSSPYTDYRPNAPAANLDLPGAAILAAMNTSADIFGSRLAGQPKHTDQGYKYLTGCLKTGYAPTNWSDITIHYYCQMSQPRACYTYALSGKSTGGIKLPRPKAYQGCAAGKLQQAADFAFVTKTQPQIFQYVMFGQTHAFNHEQEQAIINAFYGVKNPANRSECQLKRPRRTEDPTDGTHCLVNKTMSVRLAGKGD